MMQSTPNTRRLILGTAQLGMNYGINNQTGQPSISEIKKILRQAQDSDVQYIDTADSYGNSCDLLAEANVQNFKIMSKFVPQKDIAFDIVLAKSLQRLKVNKLYCYSFHNFTDLTYFQDWNSVKKIKNQGLVKKIGVSIYNNDQFEAAIQNPNIDLIQIPFNVLDHWLYRGPLIKSAIASGKEVHCRSIYLQGLLLMEPQKIPDSLVDLKPTILKINEIAKKTDRSNYELCIAYALSFPQISGLVIGIETEAQVKQNIEAFQRPTLNQEIIDQIHNIEVKNKTLLNPANWKKF